MLRTIFILLWFLLFFIVTLPLLFIAALWSLVNKEKSRLFAQSTVRILVRGILILSGVRLTVKGKENIPEGEACLFVPNHRSYFDFLVTFDSVKSPVINIGKKELKYVPVMGQWISLMGTLLLDRKSKKSGLLVIKEAVENVKAGVNVFIYPEGTRNKGTEEELLPFHEGSLKISQWSHCKTVPVAILRSRDVYENHRPRITPADVTLLFGEPIDPEELSREDRKRYGALVRERITEMIRREEKLLKGEKDD